MSKKRQDDLVDFGFETVSAAEKGRRVRGVFSSVAVRYDLMNDLMSGGIHRIWKDAFVTQLGPRPGMRVVDVAGGTGDIAFRIIERSRRGPEVAYVTVLDVNEAMVRAGTARAEASRWAEHLIWGVGDAERLPLPDACMDAYTIAFGIRNVTDRAKALKEARRVLRPGGRFLCLEFSAPVVPLLDRIYDQFSFHVIPRIGQMVAGEAESYRYLVESIRQFPDQKTFERIIAEAGFSRVGHRNLSGGIAAIHSGWAV